MKKDHDSLKRIPNLSDKFGRLLLWLQRLFELDINVVRRAGLKELAADAWLGVPKDGEETTDLDFDVENTREEAGTIPYVHTYTDRTAN